MTKEELLKCHKELCNKIQETVARKNADYTGLNADPFGNFTKVEALGICKTEIGFLTRMTDKLCRINSFVQKGALEVSDESVMDTLEDLANYSLLFAIYIKSKKEE